MSKVIVHIGTGTVMDVYDDVFIIDTEIIPDETDNWYEQDWCAFALEHGEPLGAYIRDLIRVNQLNGGNNGTV